MSIKKESLRKEFAKKRMVNFDRIEINIYKQVEDLLKNNPYQYKTEKYVGIYWPLKGEVNLMNLCKIEKIKFAFPSTNKNKKMNYHPFSNQVFVKDSMGIPYPKTNNCLEPFEMSLMLVPAIAIDKHGYRLGYGGGYFDKLRSNKEWRSVISLAVLPSSCLLNKELPKQSWDIPFDGWITENGFERSLSK
tara:strand:+ start:6282 stop:6851 length:570 start_codon:yes stop_codon:yes gene_type:complete